MNVTINFTKRQLYTFLFALSLVFASVLVVAFGGTDPTVLGHSARELLVNGSSIADNNITSTHVLDNSLTGSDIDESTLSGITASNANACSADGNCGISDATITGDVTFSVGGGNLVFAANNDGIGWASISSGSPLISTQGGTGDLELGGAGLWSNPAIAMFVRIAAVGDIMIKSGGAGGVAGQALCKSSGTMSTFGEVGTCSTAVNGTGGCTCV